MFVLEKRDESRTDTQIWPIPPTEWTGTQLTESVSSLIKSCLFNTCGHPAIVKGKSFRQSVVAELQCLLFFLIFKGKVPNWGMITGFICVFVCERERETLRSIQ